MQKTTEVLKGLLEVISNNSQRTDSGEFPIENINLLKKEKLMTTLISNNNNNITKKIIDCSQLVQEIGKHCLSTSMIYGMHCQQIFTIFNLEDSKAKNMIIKRLIDKQEYLSSVTSEYVKGGHLLTSNSAIDYIDEGHMFLNRKAPVVTGGQFADGFLITMKRSSNSNKDDVVLVFAFKEEIQASVKGEWSALGMRGTQSVPMEFNGVLCRDRILNINPFIDIAKIYTIPLGHIMWASSWLGSIKAAFKQFIKIIKRNQEKRNSETVLSKVSEIRLLIETVDIYLKSVIEKYTRYLQNDVKIIDWNKFSIHINNLKILASENLYKAINIIIEVVGMYFGYQQIEGINFERTLRDLRSASIMFHNNRLKEVNGKISLFNSEI
ncbi:Acyl-CoA dehydrogenase/oxidase C-terminal domain-containing protein [Bacillus subtilis]